MTLEINLNRKTLQDAIIRSMGKELIIQFGDEYTYLFRGITSRYVILDTGENDWFMAAMVTLIAEKEFFLP
jgi:hypothetical protein